MSTTTTPSQDVQEMVAQSDTGARNPLGFSGRILWFVPLCWSLFQLWYASPLPFIFNFGVLNDTEARSIHLMFAVFLAFTAYPASKTSSRDHIRLEYSTDLGKNWKLVNEPCLPSMSKTNMTNQKRCKGNPVDATSILLF